MSTSTTTRTPELFPGNHPNLEMQADQIIHDLIIQTSQQEYDAVMVEGLIKKHEQLMS